MKQINTTLFALNKNGSYQQWKVFVDGSIVIVEFGKEGGKLQTKNTTCTPKNVGRANVTTAEEQAVLEAKSKWEKQVRLGYRKDKSELEDSVVISPMLAADATKKSHMIKYPCYVQPKLDGLRLLVTFDEKGEPVFNSRGNKTYPIKGKLVSQMKELRLLTGWDMFDGELYIHGLPLQKTVSLAKKWREIKTEEFSGYCSNDLQFHLFDIPSKLEWYSEEGESFGWGEPISREHALVQADHIITDSLYDDNEYGDIKLTHIIPVLGKLLFTEDEVKNSIGAYMQDGYEGTIIRNYKGKYEFNQRSNDLLKCKIFKDTEAKVISVEKDKNDEGVLVCEDKDGILVRMKMKGTHDFRLYENQLQFIGEWINFTYQGRTEDNNYQFPVGQRIREIGNNGEFID